MVPHQGLPDKCLCGVIEPPKLGNDRIAKKDSVGSPAVKNLPMIVRLEGESEIISARGRKGRGRHRLFPSLGIGSVLGCPGGPIVSQRLSGSKKTQSLDRGKAPRQCGPENSAFLLREIGLQAIAFEIMGRSEASVRMTLLANADRAVL